MTEGFQIVSNRCDRSGCDIRFLNQQVADKATAFHSSFPQYRPTPLRRLQALAGQMGVGEIFVKDESYRFGLNAFKVLGGSFAIGQYIAQRLSRDLSELPYSVMTSPEVKRELGELTFVTATDGNHGRGVAWTANQLGQKSVVYMPKGSAPERLENIRKENSDASITDLRYDDTVRLAKQRAEQPNCVLVQDTSWDGYTEVPSWILQGYTTMANEVREELESQQLLAPTHIFLQAGVGSMPAALAGYFTNIYAQHKPIITVVEPNKADCIFRTARAADGRLHFVTEEMNTIMAGLACGEPLPHRLGGAARLRRLLHLLPGLCRRQGHAHPLQPAAGGRTDYFRRVGGLGLRLRDGDPQQSPPFPPSGRSWGLTAVPACSLSAPRAQPTGRITGRLSGDGKYPSF